MRLLVYGLTLLLCLALPGALLFWLWRACATSRAYLLCLAALVAIVLVVLSFSELGAWYVFGRFWPATFAVAFVGIAVQRMRRGIPRAWLPARWSREFWLTAVTAGLSAAGSLLLPLLWQARAYEGEPLELAAPLARGTDYYVMGGGANASVNHHAFIPAQRYALDLVALNGLGVRAKGISPDDLGDYEVFGAAVVAPCAGEVLSAVDALPNRPLMQPDLEHVFGNHVVIYCKEHSVVLAHLQLGSVSVAVGDRVEIGQRLGTVGNSGSTMEPHLHIHAVPGRHADGAGVGAALRIDGRLLIKGDSIGRD